MYLLLSCIIMRWAHSSLPASQMKLFFLLFIFLFLPSQRPYNFLACFLLICSHWTIGLSPLSAGSSLGNIEFRLQERDFSFWQIFHTLLHCLTEKNHLLGSKGFPETSVLAYREPREDEHCRISTNHNPRTEKEASITTNPYMLNCKSDANKDQIVKFNQLRKYCGSFSFKGNGYSSNSDWQNILHCVIFAHVTTLGRQGKLISALFT